MGSNRPTLILLLWLAFIPSAFSQDKLQRYVNQFNAQDDETVQNYVNNAQAYDWLKKNIPLLECPDSIIEQTYYYRWWTFRKHLTQTPDGFIFTEFILPVKHAGRYQALSCAFGHHIMEGRWLRDTTYLNQYIRYWFIADAQQPTPRFHQFSSWADWAFMSYLGQTGDTSFAFQLLPLMDADYKLWEKERRLPNGLFWQHDVKDGMEESISGGRRVKNMRPSINSYMYGNARAIAALAHLARKTDMAMAYLKDANRLQQLIQDSLWDAAAGFYKTRLADGTLSDAREEIGFIPWYFHIPDPGQARAWQQLIDTAGFNAPWGITTAERRHPAFRTHGTGGCEWDGAIWPFATTQTLKGLSNLLRTNTDHGGMTPAIFYDNLQTYARSHQKNGQPYIGEYQDEKTGYWLKGDNPRSSYYNHSGFCDLVIGDLIGVRFNYMGRVTIEPITSWKWFRLSNIPYKGHLITISWDEDGSHYKKGFYVMVDNKKYIHSKELKTTSFHL